MLLFAQSTNTVTLAARRLAATYPKWPNSWPSAFFSLSLCFVGFFNVDLARCKLISVGLSPFWPGVFVCAIRKRTPPRPQSNGRPNTTATALESRPRKISRTNKHTQSNHGQPASQQNIHGDNNSPQLSQKKKKKKKQVFFFSFFLKVKLP